MTRMVLITVLIACSLFVVPVSRASAEKIPLRVELAENRVDISTGFNGTRIVLFGTMAGDGAELVVTLRGPEETVALRRKGRVMGAWMNTRTVEFRRVPSYYDYASTIEPAAQPAYAALFAENGVGVEHLGFYPEDANEDPAIIGTFRDALISSMQRKGFYPLTGHRPQTLSPNFFKASFDLPPDVPTGLYRIETLTVKNGAVLAKEARTLQVGQVGFNARVYLFAQGNSFFYGVFAVVLALVTGWSAFTFLRRD